MRLAPKAIEIEAVVVADGPAVVAVVEAVAEEEAVAVDTVAVGASGVGRAAFTRLLLASSSWRCSCYFLSPNT